MSRAPGFTSGTSLHAELAAVPECEWIHVVRVDDLRELQVFAEYAARLGSGERDIGEASTLAWAEIHAATAVVDLKARAECMRHRGLTDSRAPSVVPVLRPA
jgi:hypothetical protein